MEVQLVKLIETKPRLWMYRDIWRFTVPGSYSIVK